MSGLRKILLLAIASSCLTTGSFVLYGQNQICKKSRIKHPVTIGFQSGKSFLFGKSMPTKKFNGHYFSNNSININMTINKHFRAEGGISYNTTPNQSNITNELGGKPSPFKYSSVSVPFTLQYYPLPHHCRLQPYCSVGFQYNNNPANITSSAGDNNANDNVQSGTKYISIIFAQGMTFEINTKIQITQSFHFIPESADKFIGFGLGIGYTLQ
jgi:hypothetical protein